MQFEKWSLKWLLWAVFFSLLMGGTQWRFPSNGYFLWEDLFRSEWGHKDFFP